MSINILVSLLNYFVSSEKELRYKAQQELLDAKLRLNIPAVPLSAAQKEQLAKLQPKDKSAALDPAEACMFIYL